MLSLGAFFERHDRRKAERARLEQGRLDQATARRDMYGPHLSGSVRREDMKVLKKNRPAGTANRDGYVMRPLNESDIVNPTKAQKRFIPKANSTRPMSPKPGDPRG